MAAEVTKYGFLDMQVCVPAAWDDNAVKQFAEEAFPCGTTQGWRIRREADYQALSPGSRERVQCECRADHVHIMLDA